MRKKTKNFTMDEWCANTSLNGVQDWWNARNHKLKFALWSAVLFSSMSITIYLTYVNILNFFTTPTVSKVSSKFQNGGLPLPQLQICSQGDINRQKLAETKLSTVIVDVLAMGFNAQFDNSANISALQYEFKSFLRKSNLSITDFYRHYVGFPCEEILFLKYTGASDHMSNCKNVSFSMSASGFPCLIMKNNGIQMWPGPTGGIRLIFAYPMNYSTDSSWFSLEVGRSIILSNFDVIDLPINYNVYISLSITEAKLLPYGDSNCVSRTNLEPSDSCFFHCWYKSVFERFNCALVGQPLEFHGGNACSFFDFPLMVPQYGAIVNDSQECVKSCRPSCNEIKYYWMVRYSPNRNKNYQNKTHIDVYFKEMLLTVVEEINAFPWDVAISNVGGQAGLWMGCSVITLIQAVFYFGKYLKLKFLTTPNEPEENKE